jgi:hypothetical protein
VVPNGAGEVTSCRHDPALHRTRRWPPAAHAPAGSDETTSVIGGSKHQMSGTHGPLAHDGGNATTRPRKVEGQALWEKWLARSPRLSRLSSAEARGVDGGGTARWVEAVIHVQPDAPDAMPVTVSGSGSSIAAVCRQAVSDHAHAASLPSHAVPAATTLFEEASSAVTRRARGIAG